MKCQKCGEETFLPFQCPYCGGQFCTAHRLPENHDCPKLEAARASRQEEAMVLGVPSSYEYTVSFGQHRRVGGRIYFSPKEVRHFAVATLVVVGVGLSIGFVGGLSLPNLTVGLVAFTVILAVSFFVHELAHKFTAQRRGLWAEFRLTLWGMVITVLLMVLPTPFKLISPGAVMISGSSRLSDIGEVSVAGPATNIVMSGVLLVVAPFVGGFSWIFVLGALLNGYIAVFNLIPFGILDGYKIFNWNRMVWGFAFAVSAVLTLLSYVLIYF
jgi:Zn-dependent protease